MQFKNNSKKNKTQYFRRIMGKTTPVAFLTGDVFLPILFLQKYFEQKENKTLYPPQKLHNVKASHFCENVCSAKSDTKNKIFLFSLC